jgi:predicted nucleotidyltransferase
VNLDEDFDIFLEKLQLDAKQVERMNSAERTLSDRLRAHFALSPKAVFLQGSYVNGSAIKPPPNAADGEYDVDLIAVCAQPGEEPTQALQRLVEALSAVGYGERIEPDPERKRPCVRLRYADDDAGGFHVDVTPAREITGQAPLEIPRPAQGQWRETAPQEYADWCTGQGEDFLRTVQQLKRWRDECQSAREAIKSIVLQVLIAAHMPRGVGVGDGPRITRTLRGIAELLAANTAAPPAVANPVLSSENLTETWPHEDYVDFIKVVAGAAELAERALGERDEAESRRLWRELLGEDFPKGPASGPPPGTPPAPAPASARTRQGAPRTEWA